MPRLGANVGSAQRRAITEKDNVMNGVGISSDEIVKADWAVTRCATAASFRRLKDLCLWA
jgi:hypothetical protein